MFFNYSNPSWTSSRLNSSKTWKGCSLVLFAMFSVLQMQPVICGTAASQYFTEDLSNWLFFPNIVKLLPPKNKAPKQTSVRNWTLKTDYVELGKYYSRVLESFHLCKINRKKQNSILYLNIKYIRIFKHTSYHSVLHVKEKVTAKQFISKMNPLSWMQDVTVKRYSLNLIYELIYPFWVRFLLPYK